MLVLKKIFVIYHLTPEKEQNADENFRKFMRKLLFFEGKCKKLLTFGKKICQKTFKIMKFKKNKTKHIASKKVQETRIYFFCIHKGSKNTNSNFIACYKSSKNMFSIFCKLKKLKKRESSFLHALLKKAQNTCGPRHTPNPSPLRIFACARNRQ